MTCSPLLNADGPTLERDSSLRSRQEREIAFWRESPEERPGARSLPSLLNKFGDAQRFAGTLESHAGRFSRAMDVLELGGGQGWASAMVKRRFDIRRVIATDLSPAAVMSAAIWERVFDVRLDGVLPCRSYEIPVRDASLDVVFAFAAAHHFVAHRRTLVEVWRVLRAGGACLYLYEPTASSITRGLALARARSHEQLVEDILEPRRLMRIAAQVGFETESRDDLSLIGRGPLKSLYYIGLKLVPPLRAVLPCTRDFVFVKPRS